MRLLLSALAVAALTLAVAGCGESSTQPIAAGMGPNPTLPEPKTSWFPTINIATAKGWPEGGKPTPAEGLEVEAFAKGLTHPRWLYVLPNGDTLVAETDAPPKPDDGQSIKGWIMAYVMKQAGSATPSANRISLLRDADGDGVAEVKTTFLEGLNSPFGMALVGGQLYVANTDALIRFPYEEGATEIKEPGVKVTDLPAGTINHHWTKNVIASRDGSKLYVTVGSNSNVAENGMDVEEHRAAILEVDPATGQFRDFATGIRNPNGMGWEPKTSVLWTVANERDEIGPDLVPDYLTSVRDGAFYGWPYSYYGQHVDNRAQPQKPDLVAKAIKPDYALGSHTASLGMTFYEGTLFPKDYAGGVFVGQHGSWNRKPRSGYKVVFVPFADGKPSGEAKDVLTGFVTDSEEALGRPVGVAVDKSGALLVADDVGGAIWRVTPSAGQS